ncbi:Rap guanine nucleotide exchange factor (GEF) 3 [Cricetulus griseus]
MITSKITHLAWMSSSDILPCPLTLQASASMEHRMSSNYTGQVGWPGDNHWQVGPAVVESPAVGAPQVESLPDVVPEGTLLNMVLKRMHRPRCCSYQLVFEHRRPSCIQGLRWTPLTNSEESLDFTVSLEQATTERVLKAGKLLHRHLLATYPTLIRDRKYHLRLYRQCCSGRELVDGILALGLGVHSRSQAVGICQVLLDEGALCHVKHDWTFQDRDAQFYRFPGPEPEPAGTHDVEEELVEAMALLSQRGPDALLTVALRKPQGDKGTSWYIIWKGSVNVVTHGKGLVTTLHEGDDFGQLALVNDAPRAATIILRENNCHFLRVDKQDFNRIIKDVEAKTMRLEEHGKVVLVLERSSQGTGPSRPPTPGRNRLENGCGNASPQTKARNAPVWLPSQEESLPSSTGAIRVGDKVPYDICRPDHSVVTLQLPVTASVREVMAALAHEDHWTKGQVLVKVNSAGDVVGLQPDARGVATSLGLNERLFVVDPQEVHELTPHPEQLGPTLGSSDMLELVSAKDLAGQLTDHDWNLFNRIHQVQQVELIHYVLGPQHLRDVTTANLERFMRRFNELQYWVATELCLCSVPGPRAQLLRKFIKLAAHLKEQKNLNSFFAVMFGLSNSAISRLAHTWERLPHKVRKLYSALERLLRMMARAVRMLHHCRSHNTGSEQSLSTRSPASTWAYVQQLKVIDNQRELSRLSRELEP